jgi:AcrR family transcriptional regulator
MGSAERRERERQALRGKILDAARELILAEGIEAVTLRRIAERIEYSPTAIYLHFKDKDDLVRELCQGDFLRLADQFAELAAIEDPIERLRETGRAYSHFALKHPAHYRLMFMTPILHEPRTELKGNPEFDAYAFVLALCREAIEKKLLRQDLKDAELVAQVVWAGVHGVVSLEIARGQDPWVKWRPARKRVDLMIDALMLGLLAPGKKV